MCIYDYGEVNFGCELIRARNYSIVEIWIDIIVLYVKMPFIEYSR